MNAFVVGEIVGIALQARRPIRITLLPKGWPAVVSLLDMQAYSKIELFPDTRGEQISQALRCKSWKKDYYRTLIVFFCEAFDRDDFTQRMEPHLEAIEVVLQEENPQEGA